MNLKFHPIKAQTKDTFILKTKNIDYIETLDSQKDITKYDWNDPWFRFSSGKEAKFIISDLEDGLNLYKYNIALIEEIETDKDSLTYVTRVLPVYIPIIKVDEDLYKKVSNNYFVKNFYW